MSSAIAATTAVVVVVIPFGTFFPSVLPVLDSANYPEQCGVIKRGAFGISCRFLAENLANYAHEESAAFRISGGGQSTSARESSGRRRRKTSPRRRRDGQDQLNKCRNSTCETRRSSERSKLRLTGRILLTYRAAPLITPFPGTKFQREISASEHQPTV